MLMLERDAISSPMAKARGFHCEDSVIPLPTSITPQNLVLFAGGIPALLEKAKGLRPGTKEWQNRILAEISSEAAPVIEKWMTEQIESQIALFQMMHGRRSTEGVDPDQWEENFANALFSFLKPHFEHIFYDITLTDRNLADWLNVHVSDPAILIGEADARKNLAGAYAEAVLKGILGLREKPGQVLSMLGIVADDKDWPAPASEDGKHPTSITQEEVEEATKHLAEAAAAKPKRGRAKAKIGPNHIHFDAEFLRQVRDQGNFTSKTLAEALETTPSRINNGIVEGGIMIDRQVAAAFAQKLTVEAARIGQTVGFIFRALMAPGNPSA